MVVFPLLFTVRWLSMVMIDRLKGKPVAIGSPGLMVMILSSTRPWPMFVWVKGGRRELLAEPLCRDWVDFP
jgi:hypothetical protein